MRAGDVIVMTGGTVIIDQGQLGRDAFVILSGSVVVRRNRRRIATLGEGDVIGEMSLFDVGPRTATAICDRDCTLFVLDQRRLLTLLDERPGIATKLLGALAGRIRSVDRTYVG